MPSTAQVIRHDRPFTFFGAGLLGVAAVAFTGFLAEAKVTPAAALTSAGQNRIAVITRTVSDAESMVRAFDEVGYTLDEVREGGQVPRILVTRLPGDLASIEKVDRRKAAFKQAVLPLILIANERIVAQRRELLNLRDIRAAGFPLADTQRAWLAARREGNRGRAQGAELGMAAIRRSRRDPEAMARGRFTR